ncbi:alpha/beta fold hydrolase [uncultured Pontibacter sp.]|uniref:alpha/beta hydrolase family protein n=1 Tax=uncultured Pontibacter sp. TaxID=453356 RepID=UPI002604F681|nr:alpha/beta fold hydrolase [uncultured Pontibacter sp.]
MKRQFFTLLLVLLSAASSFAQQPVPPSQIAGSWKGVLDISGTKLPLVLHISADPSGALSATMDSPQQGARGIPVQEVRLTQDSLYLNIKAIGGVYVGRVTSPETIEGHWKQGGYALPMQLTKGAYEAQRRKQEPTKPYPYQETEVSVENKAAGISLAGTLTMPQGKGPYPAVILFTGSGPQDRDMTVLGHKPFLVLADHLTRQGIAVLRLDDRGTGKSEGSATSATTQDFATDAQAAYTFLKGHKEVNAKKIGLLGLSEGALIAAKVAAANKDVAFVVLMAGSAVPGTELLVAQNEAIFSAAGIPDQTLQKLLKMRRAQFETAASEGDVDVASKKIRTIEQEAKAQFTAQEIQQLGLSAQSENSLVAQLSSPWMRYYLAYDPAPTLRQLKMPVLALNGSKDLQVPAAANLAATQKALKASGNKHYTVKELPGLNHLFQTANTGLHTEYAAIEETMAPVALETISAWIKGVVK